MSRKSKVKSKRTGAARVLDTASLQALLNDWNVLLAQLVSTREVLRGREHLADSATLLEIANAEKLIAETRELIMRMELSMVMVLLARASKQ